MTIHVLRSAEWCMFSCKLWCGDLLVVLPTKTIFHSIVFHFRSVSGSKWKMESQHWNGLCSYKPTKTEENRHALDSAFTAKCNHISRYFFVIITFKEANLGRSFFPSASTTNLYDVRKSLTISKFERTSKTLDNKK